MANARRNRKRERKQAGIQERDIHARAEMAQWERNAAWDANLLECDTCGLHSIHAGYVIYDVEHGIVPPWWGYPCPICGSHVGTFVEHLT